MTREEFLHVVGMDSESVKNIMLLKNETEPENGDYTELMKTWYDDVREYANTYERKYMELKEG